jgi:hypothetical protein
MKESKYKVAQRVRFLGEILIGIPLRQIEHNADGSLTIDGVYDCDDHFGCKRSKEYCSGYKYKFVGQMQNPELCNTAWCGIDNGEWVELSKWHPQKPKKFKI